ncbi:hypothetical protein ACCO45_004312 [Purpureocillium lilacinum]|uniref:Uncharacterized protein n=1 Tax=Purpureocillium lilacinum TaxID=33203 RepID=A0ACC4E4W1_PURLI
MSSATTSSRSSTKLELPTLSAAPSAAHTASSGTPSAEGQIPTAAAPEVGHHLGLALLSTILALYTVI